VALLFRYQKWGRLQGNPYTRFFSFYGLRENPFAVSPDPRYLWMTPRIQEAWEAIEYGIRSREGIILLTGEAGTGKTSLIRRLLEWLYQLRMPTAFIFNSHLEPKHLYDFMLADFGVPPDPRWQGNALMCLGQWLTKRCREGQIPVLVVDEAQGLPLQVLEEIRMLLNLETPQEKLLQIVLVGQPELEAKLNRPEARQIKQRISLRCRTAALTAKETRDYVQARLDVAGASGRTIFSPDAVEAVQAYSRGIPRVMNLLCEHALINAYAANMRVVPARVVDEVAREFHFDREKYVPSIYSTVRNASSQPDHEAILPAIPEPRQPGFQTAPTPVLSIDETAATETAAALRFSAPAESRPATAPLKQLEVALPQDASVQVPRSSDASTGTTHLLAAQQTAKSGATRTRTHQVSVDKRVLTTLRNSWPKAVLSPSQKSKLLRRGRDFRQTLYDLWSKLSDKRRVEELKGAVSAIGESGARHISTAFSKVERSMQALRKDAAPVWQRIRTSLLQWLGRPLRLRYLSAESSAIGTRGKPTKLVSWPHRARPRKSIVLPSSEPGMNLIVMRWLRQPFRASASARSPRVNSRNG
jgi:type II secretory pathway predicted ATPase ExeA